ncbi:MAG: divergent polysaccharide deacetylase family protein [Alphaproteobacteria bacterium]|nr:divergent polysaccharide deacetylase family protein [Alphaproteobacteria bacterium]
MIRCSAFAPHLGAAIGAALMAAAALAFSLGAGPAPVSPDASVAPAEPPANRFLTDNPAFTGEAVPPAPASVIAAGTAAPAAPAIAATPPHRPMLAIIIDDVGPDVAVARRLIGLDPPVTLAILPYAALAPQLAREAQDARREVFVHLPMEPGGLDDPGPWALSRAHDARAIAARVRWAFGRMPGAAGFNNHMGSGFTSDADAMARVFAALAGSEALVFVDSLTGPRSVAAEAARDAGFAALRRDVFLDNDRDQAAIAARLEEALALAASRGHAIAIGHPYPETLAVLDTLADRSAAHGVEIVSVGAIVRRTAASGQGA